INLDDGTTHWKFARGKSFDGRITAYNDSYFCYSRIINSNGHEEQIAYKGDIQTGCLTEFLSANFSEDYISLDGAAGWVIYVVKPPNDDIRLLVIYAEPLPNWNVNSFMGMYNTQTQEWEYERKLMAPPTQNTSVFMPPKIYGNKVYANVGHSLVCHDLQTGEQLWSRDFTQDFMFSGFIIEEDKIIANNEDLTLYCLNPNNGRVIWTEESAGTSGRMSYLNGIVYFVGGSSGRLHAVDINTGEIVWKIEASNLGEAAGNNFKTNAVYVIPAKNGNPAKVIALSHLYAYCFEAYQ
ncbi:MAG: PQQ-binding-like beta-propeller repeat protein, partial [Bacteroidota bacterium]|nr:PQQ-binding-like beta-propeller repeat protein [Bacteroidota bacterium]